MNPSSLSLRLLVAGAIASALSCGGPMPTGPHAAPLKALLVQRTDTGLVQCKALPNTSVAKQVGPAGAAVKVGPYVLTIPKGALRGKVTITASIPYQANFHVVEFGPDGLVFLVPASLTMSYAHCTVTGSTPGHIAVVNDSLGVLDYLSTTIDPKAQNLVGQVPHFTNYAVAW